MCRCKLVAVINRHTIEFHCLLSPGEIFSSCVFCSCLAARHLLTKPLEMRRLHSEWLAEDRSLLCSNRSLFWSPGMPGTLFSCSLGHRARNLPTPCIEKWTPGLGCTLCLSPSFAFVIWRQALAKLLRLPLNLLCRWGWHWTCHPAFAPRYLGFNSVWNAWSYFVL